MTDPTAHTSPTRRRAHHRADGEATRRRILEAALRLFRRRGFDATTMREVAEEAGLSPGAAYHYFPSKPAIALAYYEQRQRQHHERARAGFAKAKTVQERIAVAFRTGVDLFARDRRFMPALVRSVLDPTDPLSAFSAETKDTRLEAIGIFREAVDHPDVKDDMRDVVAHALWGLHMGFLLYFLHDTSPRQKKTAELMDSVLAIVPTFLALASMPGTEHLRAQLASILRSAGLLVLPEPTPTVDA